MKTSIYILLFFSSIVAISQERIPASPQIVIKIAFGETVTAGNVILKFVEVLEDSRCPKDIVCVWAGRAKVKVAISGEHIYLKELELTIGEKIKIFLVCSTVSPSKPSDLHPILLPELPGNLLIL